MGANSRISWTDHTFNPWQGCTKVSEGCQNCYAAVMSARFGGDNWGRGKSRKIFGEKHWAEPLRGGQARRHLCIVGGSFFYKIC